MEHVTILAAVRDNDERELNFLHPGPATNQKLVEMPYGELR